MVKHICDKVGCDIGDEKVLTLRSVYGYEYGYCKGFTLTHCTSSYAEGPSDDYSEELIEWLKGLGFAIVGSYGDNGMDSATNWHDTFWTYEFGYLPSEVSKDKFRIYDDDDDDEYDDERYY